MAQPFADLMKDLALARGASGDGIDPDARAMRRRIAIIVWLPGAGLVTWLAGWAQSLAVGVGGLAVLLISLWLFAERGDRIAARVRRRIGKTA